MKHPPTATPTITERDLTEFRRRLKVCVKEAGMSGRQLEERIGVATGTLSKVYSGRIKLTLRLLQEISQALKVGPDALVQSTALAGLLKGAPTSTATDELLEAHRERDELRTRLAERDAELRALKDELAAGTSSRKKAEAELAAGENQIRQLQKQLEQQQTELRSVLAEKNRVQQRVNDLGSASETLRGELRRLQTSFLMAEARVAETESIAEGWRTWGVERDQRVLYLEAELARVQKAAKAASSQEAGRLLLAGLATLGIGVAMGSSSRS